MKADEDPFVLWRCDSWSTSAGREFPWSLYEQKREELLLSVLLLWSAAELVYSKTEQQKTGTREDPHDDTSSTVGLLEQKHACFSDGDRNIWQVSVSRHGGVSELSVSALLERSADGGRYWTRRRLQTNIRRETEKFLIWRWKSLNCINMMDRRWDLYATVFISNQIQDTSLWSRRQWAKMEAGRLNEVKRGQTTGKTQSRAPCLHEEQLVEHQGSKSSGWWEMWCITDRGKVNIQDMAPSGGQRGTQIWS